MLGIVLPTPYRFRVERLPNLNSTGGTYGSLLTMEIETTVGPRKVTEAQELATHVFAVDDKFLVSHMVDATRQELLPMIHQTSIAADEYTDVGQAARPVDVTKALKEAREGNVSWLANTTDDMGVRKHDGQQT